MEYERASEVVLIIFDYEKVISMTIKEPSGITNVIKVLLYDKLDWFGIKRSAERLLVLSDLLDELLLEEVAELFEV